MDPMYLKCLWRAILWPRNKKEKKILISHRKKRGEKRKWGGERGGEGGREEGGGKGEEVGGQVGSGQR